MSNQSLFNCFFQPLGFLADLGYVYAEEPSASTDLVEFLARFVADCPGRNRQLSAAVTRAKFNGRRACIVSIARNDGERVYVDDWLRSKGFPGLSDGLDDGLISDAEFVGAAAQKLRSIAYGPFYATLAGNEWDSVSLDWRD